MMLQNGTMIKDGHDVAYTIIGKTLDSYVLQNVLSGDRTLMPFGDLDLYHAHWIISETA